MPEGEKTMQPTPSDGPAPSVPEAGVKPPEDLRPPGLLKELWLFVKEEKVWWMTPMILVLLLVGGLLIASQAVPALHFLYPLF
ncbi:MAG: hypothetical protein HYU36_13080 [Planctomycetes bacterium]|nr:hypothetical protein [Planctomycetota bacterium]